MPALFRRAPGEPEPEPTPSEAMAALIASLETNVGELRAKVSHREFREFIRDSGRSHAEAWAPIRTAARAGGGR